MYEELNDRQLEAVKHTQGPLLILAGAGSGKTKVLTSRIAFLIENNVAPYKILAITFTNKAAGEMRERVDRAVGFGADAIWVATFHSTCVRILRRYADRIGYENHFTIYDSDDQKHLIKTICKKLNIDTKRFKEKTFMAEISGAKDKLINPTEYAREANGDYVKSTYAQVYREYQSALKKNNAMDFDDLIVQTVELLQKDETVCRQYQERFEYVMVDEYQDTNTAQFELIRLLAGKYENLCVVGDDDQSIYKFRGANIQNILNFEQYYPKAHVIRLEQNYRSTQNILNAANSVIRNNYGRKEKTLWTENPTGNKIVFKQFENGDEEAYFVSHDIAAKVKEGTFGYSDCAILYRTNAQSRLFEERFVAENIPYKIIGGVNFYARKEIKDLLSYLKTIDNARDDLAVMRIINVPKRGIGATTIAKVSGYADEQGIGFYDALLRVQEISSVSRAAAKIETFVQFVQVMRTKLLSGLSIRELIEEIIEQTGYVRELEAEGTDEALSRIENIDELINKIATYEEEVDEPTLGGFLEEVALIADIDNLEEESEYVVLMTLHSAKGLEFPNVYLAGLEDGLFPSYMSISSGDESEVEEERRLMYVGITRAMKQLTITSARMRMVRGEINFARVSRFVKEIDSTLLTGTINETRPIREQSPSRQAKSAFKQNSYLTKSSAPKREAKDFGKASLSEGQLEYVVGDRVRHMKFGEGLVQEIVRGGRDFEVTVLFDNYGVKKMFATFAKLKKI
ncbi:DNA helicase PcrA [Eubacterium oxidoreducens]|uniref:ATP-dependent DNA helicase n=1 Tax=Eubacterium oxidoreducens TaxID=1732 RepID=A0A1G6BAJ0_EUBOX|nr:DNA helicase PcrA [Eubacterium oxidoreducens]SDB17682.1 DNA helicase-2 / ATP-dependent DNA helicase PcrA [Eubacterium oxidoreducens]